MNRKKMYRQNKSTMYYVVLGQCTEDMNNHLEVKGSLDDIDKESDVIMILNIIKSISYAYESNYCPFLVVHQVMKVFYVSYLNKMSSCDSYMESMTILRDAIVHCGVTLGYHPFIVNNKLKESGVNPPRSSNNQYMDILKA